MGKAITLILMLSLSIAEGAFEQIPRGARSVGLGGATVALEGDGWASFVNPACVRAIPGANAAVEYSPAQFGMGELKRGAMVASAALPVGTIAVFASAFGFDLYREIVAGFACARQVGERAALGISVRWNSLAIRGYGSGNAVGVDLGIWLQLAPGVSYGFAVRNLNCPTMGRDEEALPRTFALGVTVQPLPGSLVAMSVGKDVQHPVELGVGVEHCLANIVILRMGASHEPSTIAAGLGIKTPLLCVDYAFTMQSDLGGTHCVSVSFALPWP